MIGRPRSQNGRLFADKKSTIYQPKLYYGSKKKRHHHRILVASHDTLSKRMTHIICKNPFSLHSILRHPSIWSITPFEKLQKSEIRGKSNCFSLAVHINNMPTLLLTLKCFQPKRNIQYTLQTTFISLEIVFYYFFSCCCCQPLYIAKKV